jgi:hypothetical protein
LTAILASASASFGQSVDDDLTNCRGVNFNLPNATNPVGQWFLYDTTTTSADQDLDTHAAFGINAVRVFGSYEVWKYDAAEYRADLQDFAGKVFERDMLLVLILFDSIGAKPWENVPNMAEEYAGWIKSPHPNVLPLVPGVGSWQAYVADTVASVEAALAGAGGTGQVIYDAWNEPGGPPGLAAIQQSTANVVGEIKSRFTDPDDARVTVGFASVSHNTILIDNMPDPDDLDVISFHPYVSFESDLVADADEARSYALRGLPPTATPRPMLASEVVLHGSSQSYGHVLRWLERDNVGFLAWEGIASITKFRFIDGLFYADAPVPEARFVRDIEGINTVLSIAIARDQHVPSLVGRRKELGNEGYIPYTPVPYESTTADFHDLMSDWSTYFVPAVHTVDFLKGSGSKFKNGLLRLEGANMSQQEKDDVNTHWAAFEAAETNAAAAAAIEQMAAVFVPYLPPHREPSNTVPEVVYLRGDLVVVPSFPLAEISMEVQMLVNDADRLSDVASAKVSVWSGGQWVLLREETTAQLALDGYVSGSFHPPLPLSGSYLVKGEVTDMDDQVDTAMITVQ